METELKECGEKSKKGAIIFACLFSCCPAYDFFFLCPYSDCLGALCVFFSCRSQRRCQAARETSRCRVGEQERAVAMPFGPASNGLSVVG